MKPAIALLSFILFLAAQIACNEASSYTKDDTSSVDVSTEDTASVQFPRVKYSWLAGMACDTVNNLRNEFSTPDGFVRVKAESGSFGEWLRFLPLHQHGKEVLLYNGQPKKRQDVHAAVIRIDPGTTDLQQCADAVMRLRAEYLFSTQQYNAIHFNYTSGDNCDYVEWTNGTRLAVAGNKVSRIKVGHRQEKTDHGVFRKFMNEVFMYAGTLSLAKEMNSVSVDSMQIGDVFIYGGSPGHAVIVVDMCVNKAGEKLFLIAQSYMPAQEIHVLKNPENSGLSPWYSTNFGDVLKTPEWEFSKSELKRFQ